MKIQIESQFSKEIIAGTIQDAIFAIRDLARTNETIPNSSRNRLDSLCLVMTTPQPIKPVKIPCPKCHSGQTLFVKKTGVQWCRKCGAEWKNQPIVSGNQPERVNN